VNSQAASTAVPPPEPARHAAVGSGGMETDGFGHGDARKLIGMTLWLESYAATLLAALPIGTIVVRTIIGNNS